MKRLLFGLFTLIGIAGFLSAAPVTAPRTFVRTIVTNDIHNVFTRPLCTFPTYAIDWTATNCTLSLQDDVSNAINAGDKVRVDVATNTILKSLQVVTNVSNGTNLIWRQSFPSAGSVSETNGGVTVVLMYSRATVLGMKSGTETNTGTVYLGTSTNLTPYALAPGGEVTISPPSPMELNDWWLRAATSGDGVVVIYWP